ncbi:RNA polymerase sigma factor [Bacteroidia bacterium]|nr:RNA polymerase sigma factor [Bacteroidia bacterium]
MTEEQLINGCIKQDRRSQNELYKLYFPLMSSIALRYAPERDEALLYVNGGYYKVLKSLKTYDQKHTLATWIRRILVNHIIDEFRKQQKYIANIELAEHINDLNSADYNIGESHFDVEDLRAMLNTLPVVTSKVFNLFAIDGYKHKEIAERLGISIGTSKWHVNEARKKLKKQLEATAQKEKKVII